MYPCSINANSITFINVSLSYLLRSVLLSLTARYFLVDMVKTSVYKLEKDLRPFSDNPFSTKITTTHHIHIIFIFKKLISLIIIIKPVIFIGVLHFFMIFGMLFFYFFNRTGYSYIIVICGWRISMVINCYSIFFLSFNRFNRRPFRIIYLFTGFLIRPNSNVKFFIRLKIADCIIVFNIPLNPSLKFFIRANLNMISCRSFYRR